MSLLPLALLALTGYLLWRYNNRSRTVRLPPGPEPLPFVGSLFDVSRRNPYETFIEWTKTYGDIVSANVMRQTIIILGSSQTVYDFLDRSAIYSDRPCSIMVSELMGFGSSLALLPHDDSFRKQMKAFRLGFGPGVIKKYYPIISRESRTLLHRLLLDPDGFIRHLRLTTAATTLESIFGIHISGWDNTLLKWAEATTNSVGAGIIPGTWLVEQISFMKHIPTWFPLATFKRLAAEGKRNIEYLRTVPLSLVKDELAQGQTSVSALPTILMNARASQDRSDLEEVANLAMLSGYTAAIDTTYAVLQVFFLAMAIHPEAQRKASLELDNVVGTGRLPGPDDRPNLPYLNALIKEVIRWKPVSPFGLPHCARASSEYRGYHIPRGSIIMPNYWALLSNPSTYPEPQDFKPERFLRDGVSGKPNPDPDQAFGSGRRACPGRWFADAALYSVISHVLAVFTIERPLDQDGNEIHLEGTMHPNFVSSPEPFKVRITPRSSAAKVLIEQAQEELA